MPLTSPELGGSLPRRVRPFTLDLEPESGYTGTYSTKTPETNDKKESTDDGDNEPISIPRKFKVTW